MLLSGTTVAATTAKQEAMRQLLGVTPHYGRAIVLGNAPLPERLKREVDAVGMSLNGWEAYVIEPRDSEGEPLSPETAPADFDGDITDIAYVAVREPNAPNAFHPQIGTLTTTVLVEQVSRHDFLASLEAQEVAAVDQFRAELDDVLFEIAAQLDDDGEPVSDDDEPGGGFVD